MKPLHPKILAQVATLESRFPQDIIVVYDDKGMYRYVSANRQAIMGYSAAETLGHHYKDFVVPEYMAHVKLTWDDTALTGQSIESTVMLRKKSGQTARFRTVAWAVSHPETGDFYMIVKSRPMTEQN